MPKRPKQHVIDELAQRFFREALPPEWVISPVTPDYSKDFFVEVVSKEEVTGKLFFVQLKGKQSSTTRRKDNTFSVPVKRDHLHYFLQKLRLPIFVVAVDVGTGESFYEFAQRHIEQNPKLLGNKRTGTATFHVSREHRLNDTAALLTELKSAWEFMHDKYPGSVAAAVKHRRQMLETLDPRFTYDLTIRDGQEHVMVQAKDPVELRLVLTGDKELVAKSFERFMGEGVPLESGPNLSITVEGLPAFGDGSGRIASIVHTPIRPVEVTLFVEDAQGQRVHSPEFRANLGGGFTIQKLRGELANCPLAIDVTLGPVVDALLKVTLSWHFDSRAWVGQQIGKLPWFDRLRTLIKAAAGSEARAGILVSEQGNALLDVITSTGTEARRFALCLPYLELLSDCRHICRTLALPVTVPEEWTKEALQDVEELYALTTTGRYTFPGTYNFRGTMDRLPFSRQEMQDKQGTVRLKFDESTYKFLGTEFDFTEVLLEVSQWRDVKCRNFTQGGAEQTEIELFSCKKAYVWPRFTPAQANESAA